MITVKNSDVPCIQKRDGSFVDFDASKIKIAIQKANRDVAETERANDVVIQRIIDCIQRKVSQGSLSVEEIQDMVEVGLMESGCFELAKAYIVFRYERALIRKANSTDDSILSFIKNNNKFLSEENSNKDTVIASTQRDLIAGEVSKDLAKRILLPEHIVKAHEEGILHFHDMDYFLQNIFNCCLINMGDMLDNGTVLNGKMIETPKSFQVACTVMTQIISVVASNQYGGQSVNMQCLGKYLHYTYLKYRNHYIEEMQLSEELADRLAGDVMRDQLRSGIQTVQYQINTLMTTNGQSPFVTLFLWIDPDDEFAEYNAMIIAEILRQRLKGVKNEKGAWITPAFPKLVYVLDECNCLRGGEYDYLTKLAVKCSAKRMYPDYVSAKIMRENYQGNVFSPMGCRSFLSPWKDEQGNYKFEGRFNQGVVSINLPQIGILAGGNETKFWELLEERLGLCFTALMCRHRALEGTKSDISPVHWQHGAIARLKRGETIDKLLHDGYSTLSLGYIGIYETTKLITGESHSDGKGREFAIRLMERLRAACNAWKEATGIGFALYGTPAESLCYRFAELDREKFGEIPDVTDKGFYTNSYHVDVREKINAFNKLAVESEFQKISSGGAISYVEVPYLIKNLEALEELIKFIYDHMVYSQVVLRRNKTRAFQ